MARTSRFKPLLFAYSLFALVVGGGLLAMGAHTTSTDAGMAFLDWPLSNGSLNPEGWTEDPAQRAEHGHRILGLKLGLLSLGLAIWCQIREERRWVRILAWSLGGLILFQGILGGLRVLLDPANLGDAAAGVAYTFRVLHTVFAQITLATLVTAVIALSPALTKPQASVWPGGTKRVIPWALAATLLTLGQIVIGAIMRHGNAGLAIHTFPESTPEGDWLPAVWNWAVAINFTHRIGAMVVSVAVLGFVWKVFAEPEVRRKLAIPATLAALLVVAQIVLGAVVTLTMIHPHAATLHTVLGSTLLAVLWGAAFVALRGMKKRKNLAAEPPDGQESNLSPIPAEPVA